MRHSTLATRVTATVGVAITALVLTATAAASAAPMTDEQVALFCAGTVLVNREKGTNTPVPDLCPPEYDQYKQRNLK